jgi:hypothetical protein
MDKKERGRGRRGRRRWRRRKGGRRREKRWRRRRGRRERGRGRGIRRRRRRVIPVLDRQGHEASCVPRQLTPGRRTLGSLDNAYKAGWRGM